MSRPPLNGIVHFWDEWRSGYERSRLSTTPTEVPASPTIRMEASINEESNPNKTENGLLSRSRYK